MLFPLLSKSFVGSVLVFALPLTSLAATNHAASMLANTRDLSTHVDEFGDVISRFNGGLPDFFSIGKSIYGMHQSRQAAMDNLRNVDVLSEQEAVDFLNHGSNVHDAVKKALQSAVKQRDSINTLGLGRIAEGFMYGFSRQVTDFQELAKTKLPPGNDTLLDSRIQSLRSAFGEAGDAFN